MKTINDLDTIIEELNMDRDGVQVYEVGDVVQVYKRGIGLILRHNSSYHPMYFSTDDAILIERFKQLLLERKQELINEFEKD